MFRPARKQDRKTIKLKRKTASWLREISELMSDGKMLNLFDSFIIENITSAKMISPREVAKMRLLWLFGP